MSCLFEVIYTHCLAVWNDAVPVWLSGVIQPCLTGFMPSQTDINLSVYFYTCISDRCNSFGIILLCVCLALTAKWTDIQTWILTRKSIGRIFRSSLKVMVIGQSPRPTNNNVFLLDVINISGNYNEKARKWLIWIYEYDAGCFQSVCTLIERSSSTNKKYSEYSGHHDIIILDNECKYSFQIKVHIDLN